MSEKILKFCVKTQEILVLLWHPDVGSRSLVLCEHFVATGWCRVRPSSLRTAACNASPTFGTGDPLRTNHEISKGHDFDEETQLLQILEDGIPRWLGCTSKISEDFWRILICLEEKKGKKRNIIHWYIILLRKDFVKETPARLDFCLFVAHCNAVVVPRDLHSLFGIVVVCSWRCGTGLGPSRRFLAKYQGLLALFLWPIS